MRYSTYCLTAGIIFGIVALVHLMRIVEGWELTVDGTYIPIWASWAGVVISAVLAYYGFYLGLKKPLVNAPII